MGGMSYLFSLVIDPGTGQFYSLALNSVSYYLKLFVETGIGDGNYYCHNLDKYFIEGPVSSRILTATNIHT